MIQLPYTAIIVFTAPSSISYTRASVPWQLMNKASSSVMSPFRNAFSKVFDALLPPSSLSLSLLPPLFFLLLSLSLCLFSHTPFLFLSLTYCASPPLTIGYQNALPFRGVCARSGRYGNLQTRTFAHCYIAFRKADSINEYIYFEIYFFVLFYYKRSNMQI